MKISLELECSCNLKYLNTQYEFHRVKFNPKNGHKVDYLSTELIILINFLIFLDHSVISNLTGD